MRLVPLQEVLAKQNKFGEYVQFLLTTTRRSKQVRTSPEKGESKNERGPEQPEEGENPSRHICNSRQTKRTGDFNVGRGAQRKQNSKSNSVECFEALLRRLSLAGREYSGREGEV